MKRNVLFVLLTLTALFASYAQGGGDRGKQPSGPSWQLHVQSLDGETQSVTGNLELIQGLPALVDGDTTYYVPGLLRYAGFIEGLKEGARVTVEGRSLAVNPQDSASKMLRVSLLVIGGKKYDLAVKMPPSSFSSPDGPTPHRGGAMGGSPADGPKPPRGGSAGGPPRPRN